MFKSIFNKKSRGRPKSEDQNCALKNIKLVSESLESLIKLFNDCYSIVSATKYKAIHRKGIPSMSARKTGGPWLKPKYLNLKILSHKKYFKGFPIVRVKAGNTSKNLLNENRQTIYSLCRAKEITKKVYNNIMNSIKL